MNITTLKNIDELSKKVAAWMTEYINAVLKKHDLFTLVLSGGSTPKKLFQLLATEEYKHKIDWSKVHFFWGDERYVPFTDERNNAKMAFENLLNHIPVKKEHIHIMQTDISPEESAVEYEKILHRYFGKSKHSFDLVLLGMGNDGHTLSLFPDTPFIHEKVKWTGSFYLDEQKMYRITLTPGIVNKASRIAFLVTGADKAVVLNQVMYGEHNADEYPSQIIQPYNGELYWFTDEAAAKELQ
jgi:6-phosphogluconolactonase